MARPWFRTPRAITLSIIFAVGILLVLHRFGIVQPIENFGSKIISPMTGVIADSAQRVNNLFVNVGSKRNLQQENLRLREENQSLLASAEQQRLDIAEAELVHEAQQILSERTWKGTIARVIGRSSDPTYHLYLVNRGTRQGIQPGAAVMVGRGFFIGKVLESDAETAKILLVTDSHATTAGLVENTLHTEGIVTGELGLSIKIDLLNKKDSVEVGQTIVTSGIDEGTPPGLIIGRVAHVDNLPGALFQSATVTPTADLRQLTVVTILNYHAT